ncbi:MAG: transcriptional regulator [Flexibacter sp. CG_4_10_14_3_um_filter_32_15]|nr:MAG: transcriptional regulator [Flexibacter sp. CG_4_10_14_3_um_filter_32_15]
MEREYEQVYQAILRNKQISNELEFERALIIERKLRLLISENPKYKEIRKQLRAIIKEYETKNWSNDSIITEEKLKESDYAELLAEKERLFLTKRKEIIKAKLVEFNLNQQDLGKILNHSKSYISELMNGVYPFTTRDLMIIHRLLDIKIKDLISITFPLEDINKIEKTMLQLGRKDLISRLYDS